MGLWPPTPFNIDGNPFARKDGPLVKSGSLPNSCADMAAWTGQSIWTVGHNFKNVTGSPNTCDAFADGTTFQLRRLGSTQMTLYPAPQLGYGSQSIARVTTADSGVYWNGSVGWTYSTVTPTIYLLTFRFASTPITGQKHWAGLAGDGKNGWQIECHATSGMRLALGDGTAGFNRTSYIGGTALFSGWQTMMIAIDYVNSRTRISCGGYSAEMTAITIGSPAVLSKTIGPTYLGDTWGAECDYAVSAKGVGANAYTGMDTMLASYLARI